VHTGSELNRSHSEKIRRHYKQLERTLDSERLISTLYSREIIDERQKDVLTAEHVKSTRNLALLTLMKRKSCDKFEEFLDVLRESGQEHVVQLIVAP
jgi:Caspase recruitment domain